MRKNTHKKTVIILCRWTGFLEEINNGLQASISFLAKRNSVKIAKFMLTFSAKPFQKSHFYVGVNSNFVKRFLTIGLT